MHPGGSAADGGHDALGLPVVAKFVFGRFFGEGLVEAGGEAGGVEKRAQGGLEIELAMMAEAGTKMAVGGEADFVARFAKMEVGQRANEADDGAGFLKAIILGGAMAELGRRAG